MDHTYKIFRKEIPWSTSDTFRLGFVGDIHYDTEACDRDRFNKFVAKCKAEKRYMIGMGDYHDFASAKEQKALMAAKLHETTIEGFDGIVQERNRDMAGKLKDLNIIGLVGGNHTWRLSNGYYSDEDLAQRLQTEYLGWLSVVALHFKFTGRKSYVLYMVVCHGQGGGKLPGTSINKIDDLKRVFPFADIYAMGHDHQRGCWPTATLWPVNEAKCFKIKEKRQYLVRTGSFMKSYQPDRSQYTTAGLMRPADLGGVRMDIRFTRPLKNESIIHAEIESIV